MEAHLNLVGETLGGRFELLKLIGEGGYGEVYLANQVSMDREVAVKVIHPHLAATPGVTERFEREARVASKLHHPNTVVYFDFGKDEDLLFLAMEYVHGRALSDILLEESALDLGRAAHIILQVLGALREAHKVNLIHRDLKPANILITERAGDPNFVKVIDFGLAKIVRGPSDSKPPEDGPTETGAIIGTPAFMAPEQIRGEELDGRCDLYALGVMLFVILTGQKPFQGNTPVETAAMHLTQAPPLLRNVNPAVPVALEGLVMQLLSKDRTGRPKSASVVMQTLAKLLDLPTPSGSSGLTRMVVQAEVARASRAQALGAIGSVQKDISDGETLRYPQASGVSDASRAHASPALIAVLLLALLAAAGTVAFILLSPSEDATDTPITVTSTAADGEGTGAIAESVGELDEHGIRVAGVGDATEKGRDLGNATHGFGVAMVQGSGVAAAAGAVASTVAEEEASRERRSRRRQVDDQPDEVVEAPVTETGTLVISARPWGTVYCSGARWGEAPAERDVVPGDYDCTVRGPRGQVQHLEAHVDSGRTTRETVSFD